MERYNDYKDSGVEWFGEIPTQWYVRRIKESSKKVKTGTTPSTKDGDYFSNGTENWYTPVDIKNNIITSSSRKVIKQAFKDNQISLFEENSIYLIGIGGTLGNVAISKTKSSCNQQINVITINEKINNPKFCFYQLILIGNTLLKWCNYTTMPIFTQTATKQLDLVLPPLKEQTQIANYLDAKTTAIDKKIKLLKQKIKLYKAYRKTLIYDTVRKGLDKTVKLKSSGIDWIGDIPEHWEVKRFKEICYKNHTGGTPSTSNTDMFRGENIWVTIADMKKDDFVFDSKLKLTDEAIKTSNIPITPKGSLLYSFKLTLGKIAFAAKDIYTNEAIISILPNKNIVLRYHYYMLPIYLLLNATENIYGAKMLNQKLISNALLLHPTLKEQQQIADFLDAKTTTIDNIINNIETQIITLKELRKTLINGVVTGKVKVT